VWRGAARSRPRQAKNARLHCCSSASCAELRADGVELPESDDNDTPTTTCKGKGGPYSITQRRVPQLIPVLSSQPAGDVSHKLGGRLPLLSARPAVALAILKRAATNFPAW